MKVNIELSSDDLIDGLVFHGETHADKRVIGKLYELEQILDDVILGLRNLDYQVARRQEGSAKEIKDKIDQMGIYLGINFTFEEDAE